MLLDYNHGTKLIGYYYSMSETNSYFSTEDPLIPIIEAILFTAPGPVGLSRLSEILSTTEKEVSRSINILTEHYKNFHGFRIQKLNNSFQLITAPEYGEIIQKFLGLEMTSRLTQASLEALAIIAYKQPTTRPEIEAIRGVNSDGVIKSLLSKGLIEELGRSDGVGRPIFYGVTSEFMQVFGLESLDQLPTIDFDDLANKENQQEDKRILKD